MKEKIGNIYILSSDIVSDGMRTRLTYSIRKDNARYELYYETDSSFGQYFCHEIADGVLVSILSYAMRGGYDIISEVPVSEDLYYQIVYQMIPNFCACDDRTYATKITCAHIEVPYTPKETAMAMSCGLDSLTSFYKSITDTDLPSYRVSLLTFFENGAHHSGTIGHSEKEPAIFDAQLEHVQKYCAKIGYPLLVVRSNLDEILSEVFWNDSFSNTHSFRNAGFVLLFQKLIKMYYYGAAYTNKQFDGSLFCGESAHFDHYLFSVVSTDYTKIFATFPEMNRMEKIKYLKAFDDVHDELLVCYRQGENCGRCYKCVRTLVELDFAHELDTFQRCFDLADYEKNKKKYLLRIYSKRKRDESYRELIEYGEQHHEAVPLYIRIAGPIMEGTALVIEKFNAFVRKITGSAEGPV